MSKQLRRQRQDIGSFSLPAGPLLSPRSGHLLRALSQIVQKCTSHMWQWLLDLPWLAHLFMLMARHSGVLLLMVNKLVMPSSSNRRHGSSPLHSSQLHQFSHNNGTRDMLLIRCRNFLFCFHDYQWSSIWCDVMKSVFGSFSSFCVLFVTFCLSC